MAKEHAINAIRQFGDEGRAIANRVCQKIYGFPLLWLFFI